MSSPAARLDDAPWPSAAASSPSSAPPSPAPRDRRSPGPIQYAPGEPTFEERLAVIAPVPRPRFQVTRPPVVTYRAPGDPSDQERLAAIGGFTRGPRTLPPRLLCPALPIALSGRQTGVPCNCQPMNPGLGCDCAAALPIEHKGPLARTPEPAPVPPLEPWLSRRNDGPGFDGRTLGQGPMRAAPRLEKRRPARLARLTLTELRITALGNDNPNAWAALHLSVGDKTLYSWNHDGQQVSAPATFFLAFAGFSFGLVRDTLVRARLYVSDHQGEPDHAPWRGRPYWGNHTLPADEAALLVQANGLPRTGLVQGRDFSLAYQLEVADVPDDASPRILDLEVTQAIQHFWSEQGPNNALPLIAHKPTLLRLYLESSQSLDLNNGQVDGLRGTLLVRAPDGSQTSIPSLNEITAPPALEQVRRDLWDHSLNFHFVPATDGEHHFTATLDGYQHPWARYELDFRFEPAPEPMEIRLFRTRLYYQEPGGRVAVWRDPDTGQKYPQEVSAPRRPDCGMDDLRPKSRWYVPSRESSESALLQALAILPLPAFRLRYTLPDDGEIQGPPSLQNDYDFLTFCSRLSQEPLYTGGVTTLKTDYATALGMISTDYACLNRSRYRGWHEIGGGSVVSIDRWDVLAHELSHRFGRLHNPPNRVTSPDCTASNTDPAALARDSTIGEVGVDVVGALWRLATGGMVQDAIRPATAPNIMDVCSAGGRWVSPYTWLRNLRGLQGGGAFLLTDPAI